jgi:hypothetical protein
MHEIPHLQIKRKKELQSSVKNMHYSINHEEIKTEIEKLGHMVTNIWNIKEYKTKLPTLHVSVELKSAMQNIYNSAK